MKAPSIAVVMPVYNVSAYVERCLLSVMKQSYPATECIIVDDCSTDDSIARCQRLIDTYKGDTRFVILHHDRNRGLSAARNTGTDAATSDYIYYLDSDDEITLDCLEKLVAPVMRDDSIEIVMGNYAMDYTAMSGLKNRLAPTKTSFMKDTPSELKTNEAIRNWFYRGKVTRTDTVWNKLLKLSFLKENQLFNKEGLLYEDKLWNFYLMRCLNHVAFVHDVTYLHFTRPGSIVTGTQKEERNRHMGYIFKEIAEQIIPGQRIEETEHWLKLFCNYYIDASDNPDYQFAYNAFLRQLSDGNHQKSEQYLKTVKIMARTREGKALYKGAKKWVKLLNRISK